MTLFDEIQHLISRLLDILQFTGSWTETIINVTLLFTAIYTFFFLVYIPVLYPLRRLFSPMGIPMSEATIIAWKCRKKPALFLRFYIETVIINGSTTHMPRARWRELRRIFEAQLARYNRQGTFTTRTSSISDIISEEKKELIYRYFDLCTIQEKHSPGKRLWQRHLKRNREFSPEAFASDFHITNGFLAPMARITGLNDRFEQNWLSIINNYQHMTANTLIPSDAVSLTYTWLMWGPSVQIADQRPSDSPAKEEAKSLGIYGCGDEANSVHVVLPVALRDKIFRDNRFCVECNVIGRLQNPHYYVKANRPDFDPVSSTFLDRIYYSHQSSPEYIIELTQANPVERKPGQLCSGYFTAYIWAMFSLQSASDGDRKEFFQPANSIVFFEHANLADANNYQFLRKCLLSKILLFLRQQARMSKDSGNPKQQYLYCCAMNRDLDERIQGLISSRSHLRSKLPLPSVRKGNFRIQDILETLDAHFNIGNLQVIPRQRYPDVIRFHYTVRKEESLSELCAMLADNQHLIVGAEDGKREFCAVGILRCDQDQLAYSTIAPLASATENDLLEFARHTRDNHRKEKSQ